MQIIETPNGHKISIPGTAYLSGNPSDWLPLRAMPDRPAALHRLRCGTRVDVTEVHREGDTVWLYVRNGRRQGWIDWMLINV